MKFFKNSFVFFLVLLFVILIPTSCYADGKKRNLSTPLSRLVGHWEWKGHQLYFGPVNFSTMSSSFIIVTPDFEKKGLRTIKMVKNAITTGQISEDYGKKVIEYLKKISGLTFYGSYKVLSQKPNDEQIEIHIPDIDNALPDFSYQEPPREDGSSGGRSGGFRANPFKGKRVFYIDKNGKRMILATKATPLEEAKKIVTDMTIINYIDSKMSPVSRPKSIFGTYLNKKDPGEYLELNSDGTFFLRESGMSYWGTYEIKDDIITIKLEIGLAGRGRIVGNMIIDDEGKIWLKKVD